MVEMSLRPSMYESYERLVLSVRYIVLSVVWEGIEIGVSEKRLVLSVRCIVFSVVWEEIEIRVSE